LSDDTVVRVVKLTEDQDTQVTKLWAVYDRSTESMLGNYPYDANVNIRVDAKDRRQVWMTQASYDFNIESSADHDEAQVNLPDMGDIDPTDPVLEDPEYSYDTGIQVNSGDLEGAKIIYNSSEPVTPTFGPMDEPSLSDIAGLDPIGKPLNLQPSTVFTVPVKIFIPCPSQTDLSSVSISMYNGRSWLLACNADGNVQLGGDGWMVPGSRVNHPGTSPSIEIKVYHFTGAQVMKTSASAEGSADGDSSNGDSRDMDSDGGGGCFISTVAYGSLSEPHAKALDKFRHWLRLKNIVGRSFVDIYHTYLSPVAHLIARHEILRAVVRIGLIPLQP
jgi:hypothetical protein